MKKLLLSTLCCLLAVLGLQAEIKTATLSFANTDYRTAFSTSEQVWENDGIKFTNNKGASTSNVADYSNPVRLYKSSSVKVQHTYVMTKIEFNCYNTGYAEALANSVTGATTSDKLVTVEPNAASYTIETLSAQVRLDSVTVYYDDEQEGGEEPGTGGDDGGDDTEFPTVASLTDFIAAAPTADTKITGAVTVYYQSPDKRYTFITDGTSNLMVYGSLSNVYNNGDQLTGIVGTLTEYNGMLELIPNASSFGTATAGTAIQPKSATLTAEINNCDFITLSGISISGISGKNCTLSDGTNTYAGYNQFGITISEVENATVVAIGGTYKTNKQLYIVSVTTDGGSGEEPDPIDPNAKGQENNPYTVEELIALGNPGTTGQWVTGMIVGVMNYIEGTGNVFSATELTTNSNIVIASTTEGFGTNIVAVQLPNNSKIREDLNLVDRPGNLGKEVSVCGDLIKYCGVTGVKNTTDYTIIGGLAPLPVAETESLTTFVEEQFSTNTKITGAVTVYYQSSDKKYTFITDGTTNLEVYAGGGLPYAYSNGDQLTGIIGKFSYYQNMPQLTPQVDSFGEATPGTAIQPTTTTLSTVQPADYVLIQNATITSVTANDKTTITVSDESGSRILFDRFNIGVTDATNVNILGIGAVFGEDAQLFPIEITPVTDGISEIIGENNGETVIYDLQGRKLNAPVRGINIINGRKVLVR